MKPIKHEHKKQLHDRVIERSAQLKASLIELQTDPHSATSERVRAVEQALAALATHLTGEWSSIDAPESAALSGWLETSKYLFDPSIATAATAGTRKGNGTKGPSRTVKSAARPS